MQSSKVSLPLCYIAIFWSFIPLSVKAQPLFPEGVLIYKADTVRRLEVSPAAYMIAQVVVYKKLDQLRFEIWQVNRFNKADIQKAIQIRNKKGVYTYLETSDSLLNAAANFAVFASYEGEKVHRSNRIRNGSTSNYKVDKVLKNLKWFDLPAQQVRLTGGQNEEESEIVLTNSLAIPIGLALESPLAALSGTPLEFIHCENGWMTRLTAGKIRLEKVSISLFQVDPARQIYEQ